MKDTYSILLMGNFYEPHTIRLVCHLKKENPRMQIDYFAFREEGRPLPKDYLSCFKKYTLVDYPRLINKIPILGSFIIAFWLYKSFHSYAKNHHYDIVNLHYPRTVYLFLLKDFHRIADNFIISPWGSDVLRAGKFSQRMLKILFDSADYSSGRGLSQKGAICMRDVPPEKYFLMSWGSELIDYIKDNRCIINTSEAKHKLGIDGKYVISCGYNASEGQQHSKIIEAISKIKDQLPANYLILFLVTYPKAPEYIKYLKSLVENYGINALWYEHYLDLETLFYTRMATDMFVHVQITDGANASLQEYLLCGKNCINGGWLNYPELEINGLKPYHTVDNINKLDKTILSAYKCGAPIIQEQVYEYIERRGWRHAAKLWNDFFVSIS